MVGTTRVGTLDTSRHTTGLTRLGRRLFGLRFRRTVGRLSGPVEVGTMEGSVTHVGAIRHRVRLTDSGSWSEE